jgi:hypothetical protein
MSLDADAQLETITEKFLEYDYGDKDKDTFEDENEMLSNKKINKNPMSSNKQKNENTMPSNKEKNEIKILGNEQKNETLYYYKTKKGCFFPIGYLKSNKKIDGYPKYIFIKSDKTPQNEFSQLTLSFENEKDFHKHIFTDDEMKLELAKSQLKKTAGKKTLRKRKNKKKPRRKRNTRKTY